jgi:radical SAM protein with 4Fe4S-binding SPASM domain
MPTCLFDTSGYQRLGFAFCAADTDRAYFTMDPLGNLRPCNHSPTILGNIGERSFAELATGTRMREFMAARPTFCAGCVREEFCLGGCKAAAEAEACFGSLTAMDPFLAAFHHQAQRR